MDDPQALEPSGDVTTTYEQRVQEADGRSSPRKQSIQSCYNRRCIPVTCCLPVNPDGRPCNVATAAVAAEARARREVAEADMAEANAREANANARKAELETAFLEAQLETAQREWLRCAAWASVPWGHLCSPNMMRWCSSPPECTCTLQP